MILHIALLDKFIPPFIKLVGDEFKNEDHQFWLVGSVEEYPIERSGNIYVCGENVLDKVKGFLKLLFQLHTARKVILHGLFDSRVVKLLTLFPWLLPKCYWVIWGGDLYHYKTPKVNWRAQIGEMLRGFVIRRMGHLVTYIEGDVELARQWYGAKGKHHECLMYLSNIIDPAMMVEPEEQRHDSSLNILVGNSAAPSNNHLEALARLLPYKDDDIKIFVPLSYGDQSHAEKVIEQGKARFGDKLVPMTEFMPFDKYVEFLKSIDIAIFNHRRQQAMGNTISLLGMGKKVFMRSDVSQWRCLKNLSLNVCSIEGLSMNKLDANEARENYNVIISNFTKKNLVRQLEKLFGSWFDE